MSEFRLEIDAASRGALPSRLGALNRAAADLPETDVLSAWKALNGREYIFMRAPSQTVVSRLVERYGIGTSSIMALAESDPLEPDDPELFPGRQVYCNFHGDYHNPPACS
jgi:hypothetical protein